MPATLAEVATQHNCSNILYHPMFCWHGSLFAYTRYVQCNWGYPGCICRAGLLLLLKPHTAAHPTKAICWHTQQILACKMGPLIPNVCTLFWCLKAEMDASGAAAAQLHVPCCRSPIIKLSSSLPAPNSAKVAANACCASLMEASASLYLREPESSAGT